MTIVDTLQRPKKYFVDTSRGYVHVQDVGTGDRLVAFITITSFGGALLDQALPLMAQRGYRALAIDMMGYGRSDKRDGVWRIEDIADNILEVMDAVGQPADVFVSGHFSGLVALELGARPALGLKGIVLDATPIIDAQVQANYATAPPHPQIEWTEDGAHFVQYWKQAYGLIKKLNPDWPLPAQPTNLQRRVILEFFSTICFEQATHDTHALFDVRKRMTEVKVPAQVMAGDNDWSLPHQATYLAGIPGSRAHRFKGVHPIHDLVNRDRAGEYVEVIDRFCKDVIAG